WTSAFFRAGGFKVLADDDFESVDAAARSLRDQPVRVAVLTADDETYAAQAADVAARLKSENPGLRLFLAGAPGEHEAAWREAGIEDFVNVRVNNYAFNATLADSLAK